MANLLSVAEAQAQILSQFKPGKIVSIRLQNALGRVLAENIFTPYPLPFFSNSSVDGFAVRNQDTTDSTADKPVELQIVGDIPAGTNPGFSLQPGQAARIMTGAVIPPGADAVVPVEDTNLSFQENSSLPEKVKVFHAAQAGQSIRPQGQDLAQGRLVLEKGQRLNPASLGLLASLGVDHLRVYAKPRVALFSTGDELLQPGEPLVTGKIYESNSYMLSALVENCTAQPIKLGIVPDRLESVQSSLDQAVDQKADLIVTSAGVSVGAHDYVRAAIEIHGKIDIWRVNMRPGKPLAFGSYKGVPIFGLPGNPVSAYVGFLIFVAPVLALLEGQLNLKRKVIRAILQEAVESDGRESYLRATAHVENGQWVVSPTGHQGSGNLFALTQANSLLIVPSGVKSLPAGKDIDVWLLEV